MKQQHTPDCLNRKEEILSLRINQCETDDCDCACHAEKEAFDEDDNRHKWPEDRR